MKEKLKLLAIIALIAILGFSMAACGDGDGDDGNGNGTGGGNGNGTGNGGTFTLNNIPSEYNGKYASFYGSIGVPPVLPSNTIYGYNGDLSTISSSNPLSSVAKLVVISNGEVIIPLWKGTTSRYKGNDTVDTGRVDIFQTDSHYGLDDGNVQLKSIAFDSITFSNGSATKSWSDGE